jgi:dihydroflavonol-4-reductase
MEGKEIDNSDTIVCVTGGSGFVASHIIDLLLKRGYTVRATVRRLDDSGKYDWLTALDPNYGTDEAKLSLWPAVFEEGSFDEAVDGVDYVLHTASPFFNEVNDPQTELVEPAVNGTLTVFESCLRSSKPIKRVILTSSIVAILESPHEDGTPMTERDWNMEASLTRSPYNYSKRLAEEAAWRFYHEHKEEENMFQLYAINPCLVIGPMLHTPTNLNESNDIILNILTGGFPFIMDFDLNFVDVRDVALGHLLLMESTEYKVDEAKELPENGPGRHINAAGSLTFGEIARLMKERYPDCGAPTCDFSGNFGTFVVRLSTKCGDKGTRHFIEASLGKRRILDNSKLIENYGLEYRNVQESLIELCDWLYENNYV